jgi:hypothetical protein
MFYYPQTFPKKTIKSSPKYQSCPIAFVGLLAYWEIKAAQTSEQC